MALLLPALSSLTVVMRGRALPQGKHPHVVIHGPGGLRLVLQVTLPVVEHSDWSFEWVELERPGQVPILRRKFKKLRRMEVEALIFNRDGSPVDAQLDMISLLAETVEGPLIVAYGPLEGGYWRLVEANVTSQERQEGTNQITRAEVSFTFVQAYYEATKPVSAKVPAGSPSPSSPPAPATAAPTPAAPRKYTVAKGDTLSAIAARMYGNANLWPRIADANKLRNPHLIFPGQVLTIP